jgi:hypothetical protein
LLRAGQRLEIADLALVAQHRIHAAFREAGADRHDGIPADVERMTDLGQAPAFAQFEQDLGPRASTSALVAQVDESLQAGAVNFREHDLIAGHGRRRVR